MVIPAVVSGDSPRQIFLGISEVEESLNKANMVAETLTISTNKSEVDVAKIAEKMNVYYRSPEFQGKLRAKRKG
jgi:hypothetical protein